MVYCCGDKLRKKLSDKKKTTIQRAIINWKNFLPDIFLSKTIQRLKIIWIEEEVNWIAVTD